MSKEQEALYNLQKENEHLKQKIDQIQEIRDYTLKELSIYKQALDSICNDYAQEYTPPKNYDNWKEFYLKESEKN